VPIDYPPISQAQIATDFWRYATFLLQFAPPLNNEQELRERFARIGIKSGGEWPAPGLPQATLAAIDLGAEQTRETLDADTRSLKSSVGVFGTPEQMAGKYRERALGAWGGIYGNDLEETSGCREAGKLAAGAGRTDGTGHEDVPAESGCARGKMETAGNRGSTRGRATVTVSG
jgi:hypothetical protein